MCSSDSCVYVDYKYHFTDQFGGRKEEIGKKDSNVTFSYILFECLFEMLHFV